MAQPLDYLQVPRDDARIAWVLQLALSGFVCSLAAGSCFLTCERLPISPSHLQMPSCSSALFQFCSQGTLFLS